ncbi:hypothetical protein Moror_7979 [Moniliophthora roreri MCA 2997]|uniref:Uncharacterized protein n=1 Tax=Moniliophthora roreri (strain MCA 2997) TaxID=1381753 RepID=V2XL93_MONRO|nr:hypothetical protein Moror_7979 [Moniliophthora roreri MCA 2997]
MLGLAATSDALGYTSIACWLGAQLPQVVENIQRHSCEGLALPFLANWLLGDISNLIGCLLTHQLPFQTWLAAYFVLVDMTLLGQYIYYQNLKPPPPLHTRSRSTTARRMSVDRPRTRYRTLSAVAANVAAAAAALAAQQDEVREHSVQGSRLFRSPRDAEGSTSRMTRNTDEDQVDDGAMGALADSFHSEGGRTIGRKRVSWSKERYGGRAGSVGRQPQLLQGGLVPMSSAEPVPTGPSSGRGRPETATLDSTASLRHSSVASRQGAGLAFLSVFALFSVGTLVQQRSNKGSVLVPRAVEVNPGAFSLDDNRSGVPHPPFPIDLADPDKISDAFSPHSDEGTHTDTIYISSPPHIPQNEPVSIAETPRDRILGRIFAWLCTTLYLTSRLPQIWKNFVRKSVEGLSMYLFVFAFLGNTFYVASILTSPKVYQPLPASREFIKESMPYLLGSGGTLMFDITIVMQSFIYRSKPRRHTRSTSRTIVEEERGLLAGDSLAHPPYNANNSTVHSRDRTSSSHRT